MLILISLYVLFLLLTLTYVGINAYHLISFRLPLKGDLSHILLIVYLVVVIGIIGGSILLAMIAYYNAV